LTDSPVRSRFNCEEAACFSELDISTAASNFSS
jgi:hypothetical protein